MRASLASLAAPAARGLGLVPAAPPVPVREILRRFWPYARPFRRWIAVSLVLVAAVPAVETAEIWLFKLVVDDVLTPRDFGPLVWIASLYVGLNLLSSVLSYGDECLATWVGERFLRSLRSSVFGHLQRLAPDFHDRRRLGDVLTRLTSDVRAVEDFLLSGVGSTIAALMRILFFGGALFWLDWQLALVAMTVAPVFWVATRAFARRIREASREKRRRGGSLASVAEESLSNTTLVQTFNRQDAELTRFDEEGAAVADAELAATRISALFSSFINLVELAGVLTVIALGTWALTRGRLTLGGLLVFLAYLGQLYRPIRDLGQLGATIFSASAGAERILELLDQPPRITDRPGARRLDRVRGAVALEDVTFRYPGTELDALRDVSVRVEPGQVLALVGPSGAGKSTVAKLAVRLFDPDHGTIRLDGHDVRELRLDALRDHVTVLLQETLVFDGSVRDNIAFGRPDASDAQIVAAARAADADGFIRALPDGYATVVGEKGRLLSGGQRQRVGIARAFLRDTSVLVLDEPSTGLDPESAERVLGPLRRLMTGRTVILITHTLRLVRDADAIAVLDRGNLVEVGAHDDLVARGGIYAGMVGETGPPRRVLVSP